MKANATAGFTLIEMMIVLVVIGILFFVALPAYQNSVIKSNRSAGRGVLLDVASRQEQYFINNKSYADTLAKLGYDVDGSDLFYVNRQVDRSNSPDSDSVYQISLNLLSTIAYSVTATPRGFQVKDNRCKAFTITSAGVKTTSGPGSFAECW